jgi:hypothetical protein
VNNWLAVRITAAVGTMWCAYIFAGLAAYGFPYHNIVPTAVVQWISQEFLQLVLLSIILVGQRVQSDQLSQVQTTVKEHHRLFKELHYGKKEAQG